VFSARGRYDQVVMRSEQVRMRPTVQRRQGKATHDDASRAAGYSTASGLEWTASKGAARNERAACSRPESERPFDRPGTGANSEQGAVRNERPARSRKTGCVGGLTGANSEQGAGRNEQRGGQERAEGRARTSKGVGRGAARNEQRGGQERAKGWAEGRPGMSKGAARNEQRGGQERAKGRPGMSKGAARNEQRGGQERAKGRPGTSEAVWHVEWSCDSMMSGRVGHVI
jgi:hypothetical protein